MWHPVAECPCSVLLRRENADKLRKACFEDRLRERFAYLCRGYKRLPCVSLWLIFLVAVVSKFWMLCGLLLQCFLILQYDVLCNCIVSSRCSGLLLSTLLLKFCLKFALHPLYLLSNRSLFGSVLFVCGRFHATTAPESLKLRSWRVVRSFPPRHQ